MYLTFFYICFMVLSVSVSSTVCAGSDSNPRLGTTAIILNCPNDLEKRLEAVKDETTREFYGYCRAMILAEAEGLTRKESFFNKFSHSPLFHLFELLSIRYYQTPTLESFIHYMLTEKPAQVTERPLLKTMMKLCKAYPDMTIGEMIKKVESQQHKDKDINVFLDYKANSIKKHQQALAEIGLDQPESSGETYGETYGESCGESWFDSWFKQAKLSGVISTLTHLASSLVSPFGLLTMALPCGVSGFDCLNGTKISDTQVCDGSNDCVYGRDEKASKCCAGPVDPVTRLCHKKGDPGTKFYVCQDGQQVIRAQWQCDDVYQCFDFSDDHTANPNPSCFRCKNLFELIPIVSYCNGIEDCSDGSDETPRICCENSRQWVNATDRLCDKRGDPDTKLYVCRNEQVIRAQWRCDGVNQCEDSSDEHTTGVNPPCFRCGNGTLIPRGDLLCNGADNCVDGSDERTGGMNPPCFRCNNSQLIRSDMACNGNSTCQDGSDEQALGCCENVGQWVNGTAGLCDKKGNPGTRLHICKDGQVIPAQRRCDGVSHCHDHSDERTSGMNPLCFQCDDGQLVGSDVSCDGYRDCRDGSDELTCYKPHTTPSGNTTYYGNFTDITNSTSMGNFTDITNSTDITDSPDTDNTGAILSTSLIAVGATAAGLFATYYVVMLVKHKDKIDSEGKLRWLVSPVTEPCKALLRRCGYHRVDKSPFNLEPIVIGEL